MRNPKYLLAAAAIGSLMALPQMSSASPLASGLGTANSGTPAIADGLVQKVHGFHCKRKRGPFNRTYGLHRHFRACRDYDYSYDDYPYDRPYYGHYPYRRPYYGGFPFISFGFGGFGDDDWRWRRRGWGGWGGRGGWDHDD